MSRWENVPTLQEIIRLGQVMIDLYSASYATPPAAVTLDIDDTLDVVHGHQQLSLFKAHYDERCFLPIHVYDTATGRPVAVILPLQPMTSAPAARSRKRQSCAARSKQGIRSSPGPRLGASVPASRPPRSASTSASSP